METKKCVVIGCKAVLVAKGYCAAHYKRMQRHQSVEQTRPKDWGSRERHPLYKYWCSVRRFRGDTVCELWRKDFWAFATALVSKPSGEARCELYAIDTALPIGPGNWRWQICQDRVKSKNRTEYIREWQRRARAASPDYYRGKDYERHYGITLAEYERMYELQGGVCKICGQPETKEIAGKVLRLAVDHCHDSKKVRGLLCMSCNRGLGLFNHDIPTLEAAKRYLAQPPTHTPAGSCP